MTLVLDASVLLKWLLQRPSQEPDTEKANALVESVINGAHHILQPVHWLTEIAAVLARLSPDTAISDVKLLQGLEFSVSDEPIVMQRATQIAVDTGQHIFDSLYHAVAIENEDALLITADERYRIRAGKYGRVIALSRWDTQ